LSSLSKMNINLSSKTLEEISKLGKAISSLADSKCFDALGRCKDFNVTYEGNSVVLTTLNSRTCLLLDNLRENKDFRMDSLYISPVSKEFNVKFYLEDVYYIIRSKTKKP